MEQLDMYNNLNELIDWLKYDLEEQRKEIAKDRGISKDDVKDEELVLHIGDKNKDSGTIDLLNQQYTTYNMCFNFKHILKGIDNNKNTLKKDNKDYRVCKYRINAMYCIFNFDVSTFNVIFKQEVNFLNSEFKNNKNNIDSFFLSCNFESSLIFSNCSFYTNFNFYNCLFPSEVNFEKSKFYSNIEFNGGDINDKINLNNSFIQNNLVISCNTVNNINLDNISFDNSKSLLSITNITNKIKSISFQNIVVGGIINIQNVKTEKVNFKGSIVTSGAVNPVEFKIDEFENRESALFLKNEAYARNNIIDALEYKAKEIEKHKDNISKEINKKFNINKFGDILSISLSSIYSDNGLNWIKSIFMTILVTTIFFSIFTYQIFLVQIMSLMKIIYTN